MSDNITVSWDSLDLVDELICPVCLEVPREDGLVPGPLRQQPHDLRVLLQKVGEEELLPDLPGALP